MFQWLDRENLFWNLEKATGTNFNNVAILPSSVKKKKKILKGSLWRSVRDGQNCNPHPCSRPMIPRGKRMFRIPQKLYHCLYFNTVPGFSQRDALSAAIHSTLSSPDDNPSDVPVERLHQGSCNIMVESREANSPGRTG